MKKKQQRKQHQRVRSKNQNDASKIFRTKQAAEDIKENNKLKHWINGDTDINETPNIIDVSIDEDMDIRRNNGYDERSIDGFVDLKKFVTLEFQNINQ